MCPKADFGTEGIIGLGPLKGKGVGPGLIPLILSVSRSYHCFKAHGIYISGARVFGGDSYSVYPDA